MGKKVFLLVCMALGSCNAICLLACDSRAHWEMVQMVGPFLKDHASGYFELIGDGFGAVKQLFRCGFDMMDRN